MNKMLFLVVAIISVFACDKSLTREFQLVEIEQEKSAPPKEYRPKVVVVQVVNGLDYAVDLDNEICFIRKWNTKDTSPLLPETKCHQLVLRIQPKPEAEQPK